MRNNQPITHQEVAFEPGKFIVSTTDTKGRLTYVNQYFLDISGFTETELIGADHNIVRHPEMPAAAFKSLWETVKADKPWTGMVKNRCKNGDHYWVQANVTPIREGGQVTGYLSVRTPLSRSEIDAAEVLYQKINAKQASLEPSILRKGLGWIKDRGIKAYISTYILFSLAMVAGAGWLASTETSFDSLASAFGVTALAMIALGALLIRHITTPINSAIAGLRELAEGNFSNWVITDRQDEFGALLQNLLSSQIRVGNNINKMQDQATSTGRLKEALDKVTANVMIADTDLNIIYMNDAVLSMMRTAENDFRKDLPSFDTTKLLGANIDSFHKNPAHQRGMLAALAQTFNSELSIGGRTMKFTANPVIGDQKERLGTVVEWVDRTAEIAMEREIQTIVDAAKNGDLKQRIPMEGAEGFFERLSGGINDLVDVSDRAISDTVRVLSALAKGDLTEQIEADYQGSFGQLKADLNTTVEKFTEVVTQITASASEVLSGAQEIAQGNTNLSQRTEEQAASLEETASSMEEMTSTVRQNADNANQADQLSKEARDQAEKGGEVVSGAIAAMAEISTSSRKIAEIIEVINDIAFQTNLLALNAAVEAARAGEQGRGFAVVASEVRNLAQRSATASKDIKDLIEDSVTKVSEGSNLVNRSGETLEEINASVKKVSDIIAEIAAAGQEQSAGIEQVNKAITQMDEMTQQNAALVEEAAAASVSVGDQAQGLNKLISFFTTADQSNASPRTTERRTANRPWPSQPVSETPEPALQAAAPANKVVGGDSEWEEF